MTTNTSPDHAVQFLITEFNAMCESVKVYDFKTGSLTVLPRAWPTKPPQKVKNLSAFNCPVNFDCHYRVRLGCQTTDFENDRASLISILLQKKRQTWVT